MTGKTLRELRQISISHHLARRILVSFLVTFAVSRALVLLMSSGLLPDIYLRMGDTHVHHLAFGIVLIAMVGAGLILLRPEGPGLRAASVLYGIGLGLTFDEFGIWLHLDDFYWQRASFDAVIVIAALLGLIAVGPSLRRFRPKHWVAAVGLVVALTLFGMMVVMPLWSAGRNFGTHLR
jgi:hypothetical protein